MNGSKKKNIYSAVVVHDLDSFIWFGLLNTVCVCVCVGNHLFNLGSSNQFKSTFDLTSRGPFLVILISISTGLYILNHHHGIAFATKMADLFEKFNGELFPCNLCKVCFVNWI